MTVVLIGGHGGKTADYQRAVGPHELRHYERGVPEKVGPGSVVVLCLTLMGHAQREAAQAAAKRADCNVLMLKNHTPAALVMLKNHTPAALARALKEIPCSRS